MRPIDRVVALWRIGLLPEEAVVAWADHEILRAEGVPQELLDLSLYGPARCVKSPESEFPAGAVVLTYSTEFALRSAATQLLSAESVLSFCRWCARAAMGGDLKQPEVSFGYQVDHMLHDCDDEEAAIQFVRGELPKLLPSLAEVVAPFAEVLPNQSLEPTRVGRPPLAAQLQRWAAQPVHIDHDAN